MFAEEGGSGCGERCRTIAETLDCHTPDCRVWLDSVCPTKQVRGFIDIIISEHCVRSLPAMRLVVWAAVELLWMLHDG